MFDIFPWLWNRPWSSLILELGLYWVTIVIQLMVWHKWIGFRWYAARWGDIIFLPGFALFAALALRGYTRTGNWYEKWWGVILIFLIACAVDAYNIYSQVHSGHRPLHSFTVAPEAYHTIVFPFAGLFVGITLAALIWAHAQVDWKYGAISLCFLAGFATMAVLDMTPLQDHSPAQPPYWR